MGNTSCWFGDIESEVVIGLDDTHSMLQVERLNRSVVLVAHKIDEDSLQEL